MLPGVASKASTIRQVPRRDFPINVCLPSRCILAQQTVWIISAGRLLADSDQDFRAVADRTVRQIGGDIEIDVPGIDVGQFTGIHIEEMMMRLGARIIELTNGVDIDSTQQVALAKQFERVVDRRLRNPRSDRVQTAENLVRGKMLRAIQCQPGDLDTLARCLDAVALQ